MLQIALWEPEIPPNTGNIARLCAATGTRLHLIGRLGYRLDDRSLKRAGLDYWHAVDVRHHATWSDFRTAVPGRLWAIDNPAPRIYTQTAYRPEDVLLFGSESRGLPGAIRESFAMQLLGIPMPNSQVRSLNMAAAAAIVLYEALRQLHNWRVDTPSSRPPDALAFPSRSDSEGHQPSGRSGVGTTPKLCPPSAL